LLQTLRDVGQVIRAPEKSALFIFLAIFTWFVGYNAIETFWTSYGREVLYAGQIAAGQMTADQAVAKSSGMLPYISAVFLVFALPAGFIATRFGRKRTILGGGCADGPAWRAGDVSLYPAVHGACLPMRVRCAAQRTRACLEWCARVGGRRSTLARSQLARSASKAPWEHEGAFAYVRGGLLREER